jgi:hypothetical protein
MDSSAVLPPRPKRMIALLDPCRYVREAELAIANGDREKAIELVQRVYLAFDLCATWCHALRRTDPPERNN